MNTPLTTPDAPPRGDTRSNGAPQMDPLALVGIAVVGIAVAAFSARSLFDTAVLAGVSAYLAWVLPVATDMSAVVCTRVWLSTRFSEKIRRYAAFIAIVDMVLSFLGASLHLAITVPHGEIAPVWLRLAVGGLPSLSLAAIMHLAALIAVERSTAKMAATTRRPAGKRATKTTTTQRTGVTESPVATAPAADAPEVPHKPRPEAATPEPSGASVSTPVPPKSNVVKIDRDNSRSAQMLAYLNENPDATGADLDTKFGTRNYGRRVRRAWEQRQEASGQ